MSLTSYRAAPPRDNRSDYLPVASGREGEGLAASYSSAAGAAVPLAQRVFTAEFGMGSGVWPLAMATRPSKAAERARELASGWSSAAPDTDPGPSPAGLVGGKRVVWCLLRRGLPPWLSAQLALRLSPR